ncbi:MAG: restriction endonuclease subunit S [Nitrosopumilus sp.]|nr:restriction endonuclease subunit S [Nitrosopumilus sp.]
MSLLKYVASTAIPKLNQRDMCTIPILVPPLPEQQKIASILSNIDSQIDSQTQYKDKLEKLKKSLMQKLLTGEVRV